MNGTQHGDANVVSTEYETLATSESPRSISVKRLENAICRFLIMDGEVAIRDGLFVHNKAGFTTTLLGLFRRVLCSQDISLDLFFPVPETEAEVPSRAPLASADPRNYVGVAPKITSAAASVRLSTKPPFAAPLAVRT